MFGLHPNAEISYLTTQSNVLFDNLLKLQPSGSISATGDVGKSKEDVVKDLIENLVSKIPSDQFPI